MILDLPLILETRRNHALEHATIHVLGGRYPHVHLVGRSTASGFYIYGPLATQEVAGAASEALVIGCQSPPSQAAT